MPARWREEYERLRTDEELLSLQDQIRAAEALELEIRQQLGATEPVALTQQLRERWRELERALVERHFDLVPELIKQIGSLLEPAYAAQALVQRLLQVQEHLARLKGTEQKLVALKAHVVRVQDVHQLVALMVDRLSSVVTDKLLLQRVLDAWEAIFQAPERRRVIGA